MKEFSRLLSPLTIASLVDMNLDQIEEKGDSYEEIALAKAHAAHEATGLAALGEDSGIEVIGLGYWPGIHSARWLGEEASDRQRLLALLDEVEVRCPMQRQARYVAAVALIVEGKEPIVVRGECYGQLTATLRGENGFGYDPAFLSDDLGKTFAEVPAEEKDKVSHRGRAVAQLWAAGALTLH